ncbi:MAG: 1-deoxy-D-xylulose-5-phosphate synthase [Clostridia bacterium]|nr:1-deoxy-D-xylulose-5-phosphate synthase [Clostridia bacterium]
MENFEAYKLLQGIDSPSDLRALSAEQLPQLAAEIREYLSYRVRENGGHLASNLGVVELTLAIHRVFETPTDHVIFDVGHQSYVHKLLTGRKEQFDTLRKPGGLSGFTKRQESVHDAFGAGHSSTAVSAAIGLAEAEALSGNEAFTVAVVGDGALTGGLAYEGLNNCRPDLRLVIIINENEMSISPNTGHLCEHLSHIRSSKKYLRAKAFTANALSRLPLVGKPLYRAMRALKRGVRHLFYRENLFEHMGVHYRGPIDGNDLTGLIASLEYAKQLKSSVILHVKTQKGRGDAAAEANPDLYHGVPPRGTTPCNETFSAAFGSALCRAASADARICAITAAMSHGTGLEPFRAQYPDRFFDVGIAEGHAVTFAAGLAAGDKRPVVALYSTFLQRAFDMLVHDAALQRLPVTLAIDRAGFNAADGPTHHGVFDVAMLSALPGVAIYAPVTLKGVQAALDAALQHGGVSALRYPSGGENARLLAAFYPDGVSDTTPGVRVYDSGVAPCLTVITHGRIAARALHAADTLAKEGIYVRILLCEYLAPYEVLAREVAPLLVGAALFYEEELRAGGFGENLRAALLRGGLLGTRDTHVLGAEDPFACRCEAQDVWQAAGVDAASLTASVRALMTKSKKENIEL